MRQRKRKSRDVEDCGIGSGLVEPHVDAEKGAD